MIDKETRQAMEQQAQTREDQPDDGDPLIHQYDEIDRQFYVEGVGDA